MRAFQKAAETALGAAWVAERVHEPGNVSPKPATPYAVVSVGSPGYANIRGDATAGGKFFRTVVQYVGRTDDEIGFAVEKGEAAYMNGNRLSVTGWDCSPVDPDEVVASPVIRDPDSGGLLVCTVLYPFHAYPTE